MISKYVAGQHDHDLIPPQHAPAGIDDTNAVAISIKADTQIAPLLSHQLFQLHKILLDRRIGMTVRKSAIDFSVDQKMIPGQLLDQFLNDLAGSAIAGIPGNAEVFAGDEIFQHPFDIPR